MSSKKRDPQSNETKVIIAAFVVLCIGYFMLNHIATWEEPFLGNTFHIIGGCVLIAASSIVLAFAIKKKYFPKKKKRKSRPIFLDDVQKKEKGK